MLNILTKSTLFVLVMLLTSASIIQERFRVVNLFPLKDVPEEAQDIQFSWHHWWSGEYSEQKEKYINNHFGLRDYLIRIYNQVAYELWGTTNSHAIKIGKENYLYEEDYIDAVNGVNYIGHDKIIQQVRQLKMLQDTLKKLNITFIIVLAPGKGDYFPEYIPKRYQRKLSITNQEDFRKELFNSNCYFIDFNSWFLENKNKTKYPLYSKNGFHWSAYGSWLATDSLFRSLEQKTKIDFLNWECTFIDYPAEERLSDYDAGEVLNLLLKIPSYKMAYPFITVEENAKKTRPDILVVADSYYKTILSNGIPAKVFNNHTFWYYGRPPINPDGSSSGRNGKDLRNEIEKQNIIMLLANTPNLKNFGWGFIDDAYEVYFVKK